MFALIFSYFAVPLRYQNRVLFWDVVGALLLRVVFIFVGAESCWSVTTRWSTFSALS